MKLLGFSIYSKGQLSLLEEYKNKLKLGKFFISCINPHSYAISKKDTKFATALSKASFLLPDGIGIFLTLKLMFKKIESRITGFDLFILINRYLNDVSGSIFLLGTNDKTLELIKKNLSKDFPNIKIVGSFAPPYKDKFNDQDKSIMISRINIEPIDMLWVGISSPKQDILIHETIENLNIKSAACIGAVFDYYSGNIRRPGVIIRSLGLEWLYRFYQEPTRIWRRVLVSNFIFLTDVFINFFKRK